MTKIQNSHSQNLATIDSLIACVASYGNAYHPSNPIISVAALQAKQAEAEAALQSVIEMRTGYNNAVNRRQLLFDRMNAYSIRIVGAYEACGPDAASLKDVKMIRRRMGSYRPAVGKADKPGSEGTAEIKRVRIVGGHSFQDRIDHFRSLVEAVSTDVRYVPFEEDIKPEALQVFTKALAAEQHEVREATIKLDDARVTRDRVLYDDQDGLNRLAQLTKQYVKSVFGLQSDAYRKLKGIHLRSL